jgi:DMSO/TMAO reductase YedYZ molybdopterin-dependent catalytic subunit
VTEKASLMRTYPVLDPKTAFGRVPLKPHELTSPITPMQGLFVLAHLGIPHVDLNTWTLTIDGLVRRERRLTSSDITQRPKAPWRPSTSAVEVRGSRRFRSGVW